MSVRSEILQAVRGWLKTALSLTDAQVRPDAAHVTAGKTLPAKPAPPFLKVKVTSADIAVSANEHRYGSGDSGAPTAEHFVSGERDAVVSVQGFGDEASDWLADAHMALLRSDIQSQLAAAGFSISAARAGALQDLSALVDTRHEARFNRDYTVSYRLTSTPTAGIELASSALTFSVYKGESLAADPSPFTISAELLPTSP